MMQIDFVVFQLHRRISRIKVPLLPNNLFERTCLAICPAQSELLRSLSLWLRKAERYPSNVFGSSNKSRIVCSFGWLARQPGPSPCVNADSIGYWGSSEEISTRAISSRFNHFLDVPGGFGSVALIICFRISHENRIDSKRSET